MFELRRATTVLLFGGRSDKSANVLDHSSFIAVCDIATSRFEQVIFEERSARDGILFREKCLTENLVFMRNARLALRGAHVNSCFSQCSLVGMVGDLGILALSEKDTTGHGSSLASRWRGSPPN